MKAGWIVALLLWGLGVGWGQQRPSEQPADTSTTPGIMILDLGLSTGKSRLLLPPTLQYDEALDDTSLFAFWKRTAIRPPLLGGMVQPKADLTATLRAQWARDNALQTLHTVLGSVQFGAVAYMAYRALTTEPPKPVKKK